MDNQISSKVWFLVLVLFSYVAVGQIAHSQTLEPLEEDEGYLIIAVSLFGGIPQSISISGESLFQKSIETSGLESGENFKIIPMAAGEYHWSIIHYWRWYYFGLDAKNYRFTVKPGTFNYGGHLLVDINPRAKSAYISYVDRASRTLEMLESCCSQQLDSLGLFYSNPDVADPFLEFYSELQEAKK